MRSPRKTHILICIALFASYRSSQATTVTKLLFNNPLAQRNAIAKLSSKLQSDEAHRRTNCVQLGLRNMICVYNEGRMTDFPLYDTENSDEQFNIWPNVQEPSDEQDQFVDLTRLDKDYRNTPSVGRTQHDIDGSFSEDYLDIADLSFTRKVDTNDVSNPRTHRFLTILLTAPKYSKRLNRRMFSFTDPGILHFLTSKTSSNNDENTSGEEEDSNDEDLKPKRFEVIKHSDSTEETDGTPKKEPQKEKNAKSKYVYMQGPSRILAADRRRRLRHFLPKHHDWNKEDIFKLPFLWFNGPQGQYSGIFRKPI